MKKITSLLLVLSFISCTSFIGSVRSDSSDSKEKEQKQVLLEELDTIDGINETDIEIYSLLLSVFLKNYSKNLDRNNSDVLEGKLVYLRTNTIVVKDVTSLSLNMYSTYDDNLEKDHEYILSKFPEISDDSIFSDFKSRNRNHLILDEVFNRIQFAKSFNSLNIESGSNPTQFWNSFYSLLPQAAGLVTFSSIGYNPDQTEAFLDVKFIRGSMSGNVTYLHLMKKKQRWEVVNANQHIFY
jgi:hypothetical protein